MILQRHMNKNRCSRSKRDYPSTGSAGVVPYAVVLYLDAVVGLPSPAIFDDYRRPTWSNGDHRPTIVIVLHQVQRLTASSSRLPLVLPHLLGVFSPARTPGCLNKEFPSSSLIGNGKALSKSRSAPRVVRHHFLHNF